MSIYEMYDSNELCEICRATGEKDYYNPTMDIYWINTHCAELRRNRQARKHKNIQPKASVF